MKLFTLLLAFIVFISFAQAQSAIQWQKSFGSNGYDQANCIQQTSDHGFIIVGSTGANNGDVSGAHGNNDCWVIKLDSSGATQWQKAYGGTGSDGANNIQQTSDGGYIMSAITNSTDGDVTGFHGGIGSDIWIVKFDVAGTIEWQKCYGGTKNESNSFVKSCDDGGYIIAAGSNSIDGDVVGNHSTTYDFLVIKVDALGSITWTKCYGGTSSDVANTVLQTSDGGFAVIGIETSIDGDVTGNHGSTTNSFGDYWLVKLDALGNLMWQKSYGGTRDDHPYSFEQTNDDGFIIGGTSQSLDGDVNSHFGSAGTNDYWVVKTDTVGTIQWQKNYGGSLDDNLAAIKQTADGGYILAGGTFSTNGNVTSTHYGSYDCWLVKVDTIGTIDWQQTYGGSQMELATSIIQCSNGEYAFTAYTQSSDGNTTNNWGSYDYWVVKLGSNSVRVKNHFVSATSVLVYPNPMHNEAVIKINGVSNSETIELNIFNVVGKQVASYTNINSSEIKIDRNNLESGIYFYQLKSNTSEIVNGSFLVD